MPNTTVRAAAEGMPKIDPTDKIAEPRKLTTTLLPHELPPVYAMICEGDCLDPVYPDGTRLMFSRDEPWQAGDFVVVIYKPEHVPAGEHQFLVKRLVMSPGRGYWHPDWINSSGLKPTVLVEMLNPARLIAIDPAKLLGIHKCLGEVPDELVSDHVLTDEEVRAEYPVASMSVHRVSRRGVLAGLAATGAVAVPVTAEAEPSRLADLVANFDVARAAYLKALDAEEEADHAFDELNERDPILAPGIMGTRVELRSSDRPDEIRKALAERIEKEAGRAALIFRWTGGDAATIDRWRADTLAECEATIAQWQERRSACGLTEAEVVREQATEADEDALMALLAYRPVSAADARAKVAAVGKLNRKGEYEGARWAFDALLESLLPEGEELPDEFCGWRAPAGRAVAS